MPDDAVDLLLTAARVGDRLTLTAEFETDIVGPCQRCLNDADVRVEPRGMEYVRHGDSEGAEDEEGYAAGYILDVERWVRDLIADELPPAAPVPRGLPRPVPGLRRRPERGSGPRPRGLRAARPAVMVQCRVWLTRGE